VLLSLQNSRLPYHRTEQAEKQPHDSLDPARLPTSRQREVSHYHGPPHHLLNVCTSNQPLRGYSHLRTFQNEAVAPCRRTCNGRDTQGLPGRNECVGQMLIPPLSSTCVPGKQPRETYRRLVIANDLAQGFVHQGVRHCLRLLCAGRLGNLPLSSGGVSRQSPTRSQATR
jgi:hypothetical protein